ncbi:MAG: META domain-containing protein [Nocardioides sp.]|nr:META domain-containing protein [Nocardioidaceae bacterium]MCB8955846.1 META domain-containing protein [Nocardioides sp.]
MRPRTLLALLATTFLLAACGSDGESGREGSPPTTDQLDDTTFTSVEVTGYDLVKESQITLDFKDGNLAVQAGCNTQTAGYTVDAGTLKWTGPAAATMKACSDELMAQDQWLAGIFTEGVDAFLNGHTLTLTTSDGADIVAETD